MKAYNSAPSDARRKIRRSGDAIVERARPARRKVDRAMSRVPGRGILDLGEGSTNGHRYGEHEVDALKKAIDAIPSPV
jgi:hypothetical protein